MSEVPESAKVVPMHVQWHKLCAILVGIYSGEGGITIMSEQIEQFSQKHPDDALLLNNGPEGLHLELISRAQAEAIASASGQIYNPPQPGDAADTSADNVQTFQGVPPSCINGSGESGIAPIG